jgi:hypothetical protein
MLDAFSKVEEFENTLINKDGESETFEASGKQISTALEKALQDESGDLLTREDLNALKALKYSDYEEAFA